jgi:hypothetical protein
MTTPRIFARLSKRRWLWLFAALLPVAFYAVITERNSWRPKTLLSEAAGYQVKSLSWGRNGKLWVTTVKPDSPTLHFMEWNMQRHEFTREWPIPSNEAREEGENVSISWDEQWAVIYNRDSKRLWLWNLKNQRCTIFDSMSLFFMRDQVFFGLGNPSLSPYKQANTSQSLNITKVNAQTEKITRRFSIKAPPHYVFGHDDEIVRDQFQPTVALADGEHWIVAALMVAPTPSNEYPLLQHVQISEALSGKTQHLIAADQKGDITMLYPTPDGQRLLVESDLSDNQRCLTHFQFYDLRSGKPLVDWMTEECFSVYNYSPDSDLLATSDLYGGIVRLWDTHTGQLRRTIKGKDSNVSYLEFSPDGRTLMVGGNAITLWRLK